MSQKVFKCQNDKNAGGRVIITGMRPGDEKWF